MCTSYDRRGKRTSCWFRGRDGSEPGVGGGWRGQEVRDRTLLGSGEVHEICDVRAAANRYG